MTPIEILLAVAADVGAETVLPAEELKADVVVMASHGHKGLMHLVLGNVAERVGRQVLCPVLTMRPQP